MFSAMRIARRTFLLRGLAPIASATILPTLTGCGSIFYPERVGQPRIGPLDWKVVALDGLGLLLFFVPGVVAFVVDFYNGTIFLPPYPGPEPSWEPVPGPQPHQSYSPPSPSWEPAPQPTPAPQPDESYLPPPPAAAAAPDGVNRMNPDGPSSFTLPPPDEAPPTDPMRLWDQSRLEKIAVPPGQLHAAGIERLVSRRIGRPVSLNHESARVTRLNDLAEFEQRARQLAAGEIQGLSPQDAFRGEFVSGFPSPS
jgi:hypothetical protein